MNWCLSILSLLGISIVGFTLYSIYNGRSKNMHLMAMGEDDESEDEHSMMTLESSVSENGIVEQPQFLNDLMTFSEGDSFSFETNTKMGKVVKLEGADNWSLTYYTKNSQRQNTTLFDSWSSLSTHLDDIINRSTYFNASMDGRSFSVGPKKTGKAVLLLSGNDYF